MTQKKIIDKQVACAMFATNTPFRWIEHNEVKKMFAMLRPGYIPPSRVTLAESLLDEVYQEEKNDCNVFLEGKIVSLSIDGWSNVHNEPIICSTITTGNGSVYLDRTIDTSGHPHNSNYLTDLATDLIEKCEMESKCKVCSIVTDNAANMNKMRKMVLERTNKNILAYGCSAHILNLLAKDFSNLDLKDQVVEVVKYFRNNQYASFHYKSAGGKTLILPKSVRWNSLCDCFETYIDEWPNLLKICEENRTFIDPNIGKIVADINLKRLVEGQLSILKPIAIAVDEIQKNNCSIAKAVEIWKNLQDTLKSKKIENKNMDIFNKRYKMALQPCHFLAYLISPTLTKFNLSPEEKKKHLILSRKCMVIQIS